MNSLPIMARFFRNRDVLLVISASSVKANTFWRRHHHAYISVATKTHSCQRGCNEYAANMFYQLHNLKTTFLKDSKTSLRVPESCLKLGGRTGCQPRFLCLRPYLCVTAYLTFWTKSLDSE